MNEALTSGKINDKIKFSNSVVRTYYKQYVEGIRDLLDTNAPLEQQARQAFELRNKYRTNARRIMADLKTRKELDIERPNKTFEELLNSKMERKGLTRQDALRDIIETAVKTNSKVNKELGIE